MVESPADLEGLAGVRELIGDLLLRGDGVRDLNGLACLERITGNLEIGQCDRASGECQGPSQLETLVGLEHLSSVSGRLVVAGTRGLTTLGALARLAEVGQELVIAQNANLESLQGLEQVARVGWLSIERNDRLQNLVGLDGLMEVGCNARILGNESLTSLQGLQGLTEADALSLRNTPGLRTLSGLSGLVSVGAGRACPSDQPYAWTGWGVELSRLDSLESLEGLSALARVQGRLQIVGNPRLASLAGVTRLQEIRGGLEVDRNDTLADLAGLSSVLELGANVVIGNCLRLKSLIGLSQVRWIEPEPASNYRGVAVANSPLLRSLDGLAPTGGLDLLSITGNQLLVGGGDFHGLTRVRTLSIQDNALLTSLAWLDGMGAVEQDVLIRYNPELPVCSAVQLAAEKGPSGEVDICGNLADACGGADCREDLIPPL